MKRIYVLLLSTVLIFFGCDYPVAYQNFDGTSGTFFFYGENKFYNPHRYDSESESYLDVYYYSGWGHDGEFKNKNTTFTVPDHAYSNEVTGIWCDAFEDFDNLEDLVIPKCITRMHYQTFSNCTKKLKNIYIHSKTPPSIYPTPEYYYYSSYGYELWLPPNKSLKVYVPAESVSLYKTALQWVEFKDLIYPME